MKRTRKLILALVVVMSLLMAMAVAIIPASAAGSGYYLKGSFNSWSTANEMVTASGNVLKTTVTLNANTTYEFKVNNGDNWYGNSGTIKETTLATSEVGWNLSTSNGTNCKLTTTVAGDYTFLFDKTSKNVVVIAPQMIRVYFQNTGNWSTVNAYIWSRVGDSATVATYGWPGISITGNVEGDVYYIDVPCGTSNIIFNNGSSQTADLKLGTGTCQLFNKDGKVSSGFHLDSDKNHVCDACAKTNLGTHADSNTDKDHVCDYGCGATLEECYGGTATCTEKAVCIACGEEYGEALGHSATCGHSVANVGDVYYESIKDAIDNAESGTITLVDDVTYEGTLAINKNIVIDLNGNNLVADGIVTFGYGVQIIDSGATKGLIDVDRDKLVFAPLVDEETGDETPATSTEIVPVWNGEGYVIADVTDRYVQPEVEGKADNSFIIDFKPKFDGVAHSYVKGGETATGLTFEVRITGADFDKTYTVEDSLIAEAYNGKSVRLNLINAKEGVTYTVQLIIKSECGLNYVGELGQYTYTVPADAE